MGIKNHTEFLDQVQNGKNILQKFKDNFFVAKIMQEEENKFQGPQSISSSGSKKDEYDENSERNQVMSQSFYKKEGLDYLYFARPGTSYGRFGDTG